MPSRDASLYQSSSRPRIRSSVNPHDTAFSTNFTALLSDTAAPRKRPTLSQPGLASSNRNTKKRALADILGRPTSIASSNADELSEAEWRSAQRKLDEKARLYGALKRGDVEDRGERYGVDFDRKWAERGGDVADSEENESDDGSKSDAGEMVEYVDEMGRTRTGSRKDLQAQERQKARQRRVEEAEDEDRARPSAPTNVIYGDAIQSAAFDVDADAASKMHNLAHKRDRPETPPPETHYDASAEIRTKGTGFYQFSQDEKTREEQMRGLEELRMETERAREEKQNERDEERRQRREKLEARRKLIEQKRGEKKAERFLNGLEEEILAESMSAAEQKRAEPP
ncbi:MAG: hypothetical protein Q9162_006115 [Coniocarpon cinnabarinum]